jgi:hypothetical protein
VQVQPKILKNLSEHQIYQSKRKFSQKKVCLVPKECKGAKNLYGSYQTEFAGSTQNIKKNCRSIKLTKTEQKFTQKKSV